MNAVDGEWPLGRRGLTTDELANFIGLWNEDLAPLGRQGLTGRGFWALSADGVLHLEWPLGESGNRRCLVTLMSEGIQGATGDMLATIPEDAEIQAVAVVYEPEHALSVNDDRERLAHELRAHLTGLGSLAQSLWAVYGLGSPIGRIVDDHRFRNPGALLEALTGRIVDTGRDEDTDAPITPTSTAATMRAQGVARSGRRRSPMPPATRAAVVAYVDELASLLEQARSLVPDSRILDWHAKRAIRLRELLGEDGSA